MSTKEWECVWTNPGASTWRLRVPGGWLYRHNDWETDTGEWSSVAMAFVPDPTPVVEPEKLS